MLKVNNISSGYGKKQVIFNVSFEVNQNEIVLLIGGNGSGKSTLLKSIFGLIPLWNEGNIWFNEENITGKPTAGLLKKGLLYIPQNNNLFEDLTVKENLEMAGLRLDPRYLKQQIQRVLDIYPDLKQHLNRFPLKLSGGERQMVILAMAGIHQPKLLLIDEPFTGLSPQNLNIVVEQLKAMNEKEGVTLLIVEHRIKESLAIANRIIGLKLGTIFSNTHVGENFNVDILKPIFI